MNRPHHPWPARLRFYYGWVILPSAALAIFVSGPGQTFAISQFVDPIIIEFGWSRTTVSGLYTAGSLSAAVAVLGVGWLLDRVGARIMLAAVGFCLGLASIWMSLITTQFGAYMGFVGLRTFGQGSLVMISTTLIALWFIRNRGRATAIASLGMVMSQAAFPPLIHLLITEIGWRQTWSALAIVVWFLLIPIALIFVRRSPESVGLKPDGFQDGGRQESSVQADEHIEGVTLSGAVRTRAFWLLILAGLSLSLVSTALVFHQAAVFESRGMNSATSAAVLGVMGPSSLLGTLSGGFLADRVPNRLLLVAGQALLICSGLLIISMSEVWHAIAYGILLGSTMGAVMTVSAVIWPNYFGRKHLGRIRGIATSSMVASAALGPLPFAIAHDLLHSYPSVICIFMVVPVISIIAASLARPPFPNGFPRIDSLQEDDAISL